MIPAAQCKRILSIGERLQRFEASSFEADADKAKVFISSAGLLVSKLPKFWLAVGALSGDIVECSIDAAMDVAAAQESGDAFSVDRVPHRRVRRARVDVPDDFRVLSSVELPLDVLKHLRLGISLGNLSELDKFASSHQLITRCFWFDGRFEPGWVWLVTTTGHVLVTYRRRFSLPKRLPYIGIPVWFADAAVRLANLVKASSVEFRFLKRKRVRKKSDFVEMVIGECRLIVLAETEGLLDYRFLFDTESDGIEVSAGELFDALQLIRKKSNNGGVGVVLEAGQQSLSLSCICNEAVTEQIEARCSSFPAGDFKCTIDLKRLQRLLRPFRKRAVRMMLNKVSYCMLLKLEGLPDVTFALSMLRR